MERLTGHFELDVRTLDALLGVERCFDMIARDLVAGGRRCRLYVVDGYGDDAVLERMIGFLARPALHRRRRRRADLHRPLCDLQRGQRRSRSPADGHRRVPRQNAARRGLRRMYPHRREELPSRGVEEPSSQTAGTRGAHDGFIETSCRTRRSCAAASARRS